VAETDEDDQEIAAAERLARERYELAVQQLREGHYRFSSRVRGQAGLVLEELIDPDGEAIASLADVEGDAGALALAMPLDLITFETWLFGQIGDAEALDLDIPTHRDLWFNFGAWIGETLRLRHGGHWLIAGDQPQSWRLGFSKILLEVVPHVFSEQLLRLGQGSVKKFLSEVERIRGLHAHQKQHDGGQEIDRFTPQHYVRLHTMPLGQWLVLDFRQLERLWNQAPARELIAEIAKSASRLGPANQGVVERVVDALTKANQEQPVAGQTNDRGLFEAVAQIVSLRHATAPIAMDILERFVIPAIHIGVPDAFPPIDDDEIAALRKGIELFALFVDMVPHKHPADDAGFLRAFPVSDLASPYKDRTNLEISKGDWVIVNPRNLAMMLSDLDPKRLLERYDDFVKYLHEDARTPRRRDDGRMLAEAVVRSIVDLRTSVATAIQNQCALVFRMLPPSA
jgi:hypothetical protein